MIRLGVLSQITGTAPFWQEPLDPVLRIDRELAGRGVVLVRDRPDVILVDHAGLETVRVPCPWIIFDMTDSGVLWWYGAPPGDPMRMAVKSPRVAGVLKFCKYQSLDLYHYPWSEGACHLQRIYERVPNPWPPSGLVSRIPLRPAEFAKIEVGFGYWAFALCDGLASGHIDLEAPRSVDVCFAGTMEYRSPAVAFHRRQAVERIEALRGVRHVVVRGRQLPLPAYHDLLRNARICVSPWGWGETSIRDYEAMYAGCVLVKPKTDFVELCPPVDERHYVPCAVDFSDLEEKATHVLSHWPDYAGMRAANRARLLAVRGPGAVADRLAGILRRSLERVG
jgi:hypothetical protein